MSLDEVQNGSMETPESLIPDKYWKQDKSTLTFKVEAEELIDETIYRGASTRAGLEQVSVE